MWMTSRANVVRLSLALLLLPGCTDDSGITDPRAISTDVAHFSAWTTPVNLGTPINSSANESAPVLSKDELSLYFNSNRQPGFGAMDIWVARRDCRDCAWGEPRNLGGGINSSFNEGPAGFSVDGHVLFFSSNRPGVGLSDFYIARRTDPQDDLGWSAPQLMGPEINTPAFEGGKVTLIGRTLYFARGPSGGGLQTIYVATLGPDEEVVGEVVALPELGPASGPTVRHDGREMFFHSDRDGAIGELYTATRRGATGDWSAPTNLGPPVNTPLVESLPHLSYDARTLHFTGNLRPGGFGGQDIWMTTRTP